MSWIGCVVKTSWRLASVSTRWRMRWPGGDAGRAFDVVVEPVDGNAKFFRIEAEQALLAKMRVDQRPQVRDRGIGRIQGDGAGARRLAASRATPTASSTSSPRIASR